MLSFTASNSCATFALASMGHENLLQLNCSSPLRKTAFLYLRKIAFDLGFQKFDYGMCHHGFIWVYVRDSVSFLILEVQVFVEFGKFSAIIFLNVVPASLPFPLHLGPQRQKCSIFCYCLPGSSGSVGSFFLS